MLWRHGRTSWNAGRRYQGQTDVELDDVGRAQAAHAAQLLAALRPDAIVASDLRRAADTAAALASLTGLEVRHDPRLRETGMGEWEGRTLEEVATHHAADLARWEEGGAEGRAPGGESRAEVAERTSAALLDAVASLPADGTLVAASHGGALRIGICRLLGLPVEAWGALGGLSNCSWSVLGRGRSGWRLLEHNAGSLPHPVLVQEG